LNRKLVLVLVFLMLCGSFAVLFAKPIVANQLPSDGFTIRADGSIYPSTLLISTSDNVTYTLTGNISSSSYGIVVERNNTIIDGNGYTLQGSNASNAGFLLSDVRNVTIRKTAIANFDFGIELNFSSDNTLSSNNVVSRLDGISLYYSFDNTVVSNNVTSSQEYAFDFIRSSDNTILNNNVANGQWGILLLYSSNNIWSGNNIIENVECIRLDDSFANKIFHNNFIKNKWQAFDDWNSTGAWDNGVEGNYWSDYNGTDSNQDGTGDTSYVIDANNTDHYPLMGPFQSFNVSIWNRHDDGFEEVDVISNFTISHVDLYGWLTTPNQYLQAGQIFLSLTPVQGHNITIGFCRITLPNNILNTSDYTVLIDLTPINTSKLATSNETHTALYFTFNSSALDGIMIIPEFPTFLVLPLFMMAALLAVMVYKKKQHT